MLTQLSTSFSEGGKHSTTPILRSVIIQHMLGSLSFRKFVRMSLFETDALENGRADKASDKEQDQDKSESSEPSYRPNDLIELVVEEESWQDIHTGVKDRAKNIHQQKPPWPDFNSSGSQRHKYS
jgi:hypothetical protein